MRLDNKDKHQIPIVAALNALIFEQAAVTSQITDELGELIENRDPIAGFTLLAQSQQAAKLCDTEFADIRPRAERWAAPLPRVDPDVADDKDDYTNRPSLDSDDDIALSCFEKAPSPINETRLFKRPSEAPSPMRLEKKRRAIQRGIDVD